MIYMMTSEIKNVLDSGKFGILSASTKKINGTKEEKDKTQDLYETLLKAGFKARIVFGKYTYEDGTPITEPSVLFWKEKASKAIDFMEYNEQKIIQSLAEKLKQESYIFNMLLFKTKDENGSTMVAILDFDGIIFGKDAVKEENYTMLDVNDKSTAFALTTKA